MTVQCTPIVLFLQLCRVYLAIMVGASLFGSLAWAHSVLIMTRMGVRIRSTMISSIYRKTLRLSTSSGESIDSGHILTLMSNDSQRLVETMQASCGQVYVLL